MPTAAHESLEIQEHVPLAPYTTFKIGGPARYFCTVTSEAALQVAIGFARREELEVFVMGGGSNLLVGDSGFDGLVIKVAIDSVVRWQRLPEGLLVRAPAGLDWDAFVLRTCEQAISGVECLAGIPGLIGGTPVQNVGAYGQEVADTIHEVRALDLQTLRFVDLPAIDCDFAYRQSIFNTTHRNRYIVTEVCFCFDPSASPNLSYADLKSYFAYAVAPPTPIDVYRAVREIRHRKGMLLVEGERDCRSAGSFFKNPIVAIDSLELIAKALDLNGSSIPHWPAAEGKIKLPAAWLLERAGFHKGFSLGQAGISSRHTLALVNRGHATAADIETLRDRIVAEVYGRFHIRLEQEPVQLGGDVSPPFFR